MAADWSVGARGSLTLIALLLTAGCGARRASPATPVAPPAPAMIVLLPDPETRVTGRIHVSNEFGGVDLSAPRSSLNTRANAALGPVTILSEDEVNRLFGEALAALPPAPKQFVLQFTFESDTLTDESTALIPAILAAVKALPVPEVVIIGHTDTMGDRKSNLALGLRRAMRVRNILVEAGLPASTLDVTSHGEADPLVKTRDNTPEPRNRRVGITVR